MQRQLNFRLSTYCRKDELIEDRVTRELTSIAPDFQATEEDEKFIGSADDDIIFGAGGDDIFGGGTDLSSTNEGDIFIGGMGRTSWFLLVKRMIIYSW